MIDRMQQAALQNQLAAQQAAQQLSRQRTGTTDIRSNPAGADFGTLLQQRIDQTRTPSGEVTFSKHAIARAAERGIEITENLMGRLRAGVQRAQEKGATNVIAMDNRQAFILNVPNAKVITAITQEEMVGNVFTNIDGAVFL